MKLPEFKNEKINDFTNPEIKKKQEEAIKEVESKLGQKFKLVIGGKEIASGQKLTSINPADGEQVIAVFHKATKPLAERAIKEATKKFIEWRDVPVEERATVLLKAAEIMRKRRFEINAWMILEAGKNFLEADADTAEAIDFLEFYAREAIRYAEKQPVTPVPGEKNELFYIPLGVWAVIPPWDFPGCLS